jgi:hypothetical protein
MTSTPVPTAREIVLEEHGFARTPWRGQEQSIVGIAEHGLPL